MAEPAVQFPADREDEVSEVLRPRRRSRTSAC